MKSLRRFPRRTLLRGLAGAAISLPLLESLSPRRSRAQDATFPTRFVVMFHPNGVQPEAWFPTPGASPTDFALNRAHAALEPWKSKLILTSGIDMSVCTIGFGEPHQRGMGAVLTGMENNSGSMVGGDGTTCGFNLGTSIDQVLATRVGQGTRVKSLELGVRADVATSTSEIRNRMIYAAPETPLAPLNSPQAAFTRLFSDVSTDIDTLNIKRAQRKSVLDVAIADLEGLAPRVSADERVKLDEHLALVRDLEQRLTSPTNLGGSCAVPAVPPFLAVDNEGTMQEISRLQIDMLAMALACDITRVGSLQYSNALNHVRFPWLTYVNELGQTVQSLGDGHGLSHDQGGSLYDVDEEARMRDAWYGGELAYLLSRLASIPEGDGTLLDNTVILWVNELALGNAHTHANMPFVLAGGGSGALRTGQYIQVAGQPHNNLLLGILRAFGFDDEVFGNPAYCTGVLPGMLA